MLEEPSMLGPLTQRKVVMCVGPGGVGKTTCAAAIALAAAHAGRRVAVLTVDPSLRLGQALGLAGDQGATPGAMAAVKGEYPAGGSLDALLLDTRHVFDEIVRGYSSDPDRAEAILSNPIYQATVRRLGGAVEYAAMARVQMLHAEGRHDLVVLDTPPTANAIDFLEAPSRVREVVSNPAARVLAGTGRLGMKILGLGGGTLLKTMESLAGGPFMADLGQFLREFSEILGEFQRRAGSFESLLHSLQTGVVLATTATAFSVREAEQFLDILRERGLRIDGVVLNRIEPPLPPPLAMDSLRAHLAAAGVEPVQPAIERLLQAQRWIEREASRSEEVYARLHNHLAPIPVVPLVRRHPPPSSLDDLLRMGQRLLGFEQTGPGGPSRG